MSIKKFKGKDGMPAWQFDHRDIAGKRIRKIFYNEADALRFEATFLDRKRHNVVEPQRRKFREAAESYLHDRKDRRSYDKMEYYVLCIFERFSDQWLDQITIQDVRQYRDQLKSKYSVYRANRELEVLSAVLRHAEEEQWIRKAPKVRKLTGETSRERFLSPEEIQRLFRHETRPPKRLLLGVLLYTGMRKSDVISLEWEHVDLEQRLILNRNTKTSHRRRGKGHMRWIPIADPLFDLFGGVLPWSKWVFPSPSGTKHLTNIDKWWNTLKTQAKIADARIHDLRHTAATYMAMATGSTMTGQRILGHHTGKMAERYAHPDHTWLRNGVDAAANLMTQGAPLGHSQDTREAS